MVHRTYRRLDEPPKLLGYSLPQWLALIVLGGGLVAGASAAGVLHQRVVLTVLAFVIGVPAFLWRFEEGQGVSVGGRLRDALAYIAGRRPFAPGAGARPAGYLIENETAGQPRDVRGAKVAEPARSVPWA